MIWATNATVAPIDEWTLYQPKDTIKKDTTKNLPFPVKQNNDYQFPDDNNNSGLFLNDPSNIKDEIEYDTKTNDYKFSKKIGNLNYGTPQYMSFEEYEKYDFQNSMEKYWRQRAGSENFEHKTSLIPQLHFGGEVFDRIFGNNTIDIRPQGSVELIFGINISNIENPALPVKLRKTTTFDFKENIQANIVGQIGDKLKINANFNTQATFDFENKIKLSYEGKEDDIIQKIEAGNVSLPLTGSLITGSQSLFGIKTELKFGRLSVTSLVSQQKSKTSVIEVQGGAQTSDFEIYADEYEANKHFFLSQYFYQNYDNSLVNLPVINSGVTISRIEVWVTNKSGNFQDARNIVAFMDLAEGANNIYNHNISLNPLYNYIYPCDSINSLNSFLVSNPNIREIYKTTTILESAFGLNEFNGGTDYEKIESARMLSSSEYTLNSKLGYISLNSALNADEVLAVAYEYTVGGKTYRVGEFSNSGITGQKALFVKLLKGTSLTPKLPTWKLMMKNIYSIGAYQVNSDDFLLNIYYQNDKTGTAEENIPAGAITGIRLLKVMNLDNLNSQLDPQPDGEFDFIDKFTINATNGRIIFPVLQPFGKHLRQQICKNNPADSIVAKNYIFQELYDSTQSKAQQIAEKNKFFIKGSYKSAGGSDISLNAMNVPQGSVTVTAGGIPLVENQDYTVDYSLGRVKIINQGLLESGTPIKISLENNSLFSIQSKTLLGVHLDYRVSNDLSLGATILHLNERPLTQKVNIGDEPISNTIWGIDGTYRTESQFITKLVDKIPFINTKAISTITLSGEFAQLIPGHNKAIGKNGTSYIDDFEGSITSNDIKSVTAWSLASTPLGQNSLFPEASLTNNLAYGFNRAKFCWYIIDPIMMRDNSDIPSYIKQEQNNHFVREIFEKEIFPNKQNPNNVPTNISVLNLAFYPKDRGPYNYTINSNQYSDGIDSAGYLKNPKSRWGGMMRKIESNDFEAANFEYIEFWLMDPFVYEPNHTGGELYFNLGNISEDILKDSRKSFENGLPSTSDVKLVDTTVWGRVPLIQSIVNAFDNTPSSREYQDIGLDGLSDNDERSFFGGNYQHYLDSIALIFGVNSQAYINANNDPSSDNYHYFRGGDYDSRQLSILDRYKMYNGLDGNSPTSEQSPEKYPTSSTTQPNVEDINHDNTLSEAESYFQYKVDLVPTKMQVGQNYITDVIEGKNKNGDPVKWYQFKIPIYNPDKVVGDIQDFKSIRFIRMFLKGFDEDVFLRFATLDLVRGEWRKYTSSFVEGGAYQPNDPAETNFEISAVNIEENGTRTPVNYVLPPGVTRQTDPTNPQLRQLNEQAIVLRVCELQDGDARAAYKNIDIDIRQYKKLQMFVHAEAMNNHQLNDDDLCIFVRMGSDYQNNFYEYEVPVSVTSPGSYNNNSEDQRKIVWPESNMIDFNFEVFQIAKQRRNTEMRRSGSTVTLTTYYSIMDGKNRVTVSGNPNLSNIRTIMIGVRNRSKNNNSLADDGLAKCAEIWMNELRLTNFDEKGGWAANARMTSKLADFGNVTIAGSTSTPGFGSIEKKVNERNKVQAYQYDISSNFELGKFFPERFSIRVPMYAGYSESFQNPQYDPLDPDILFSVALKDLSKEEKKKRKKEAQDYTLRKSLNFTNVKIDKTSSSGKTHIYDISNWAVSYSYSEQNSRDINTEYDDQKAYRGALTYNFNTTPKVVEPFSKSSALKSPALKLIKDFNFYYLPSQISFMTDLTRQYGETKLRNLNHPEISIPATYSKDFEWNRIYDLKYDITKNLKFDFSATNASRIDEPDGKITKEKRDTIMQNIYDFGRTTQYHHVFNLNYNIPINKIPIFNWLSSSARYSGTFDWEASPIVADKTVDLGNTITNSNSKQLNGQANMLSLYNKIKYLQKINNKYNNKKNKNQKKDKKTEKVFFPDKGQPTKKINLVANVPKPINHKLMTSNITVKVYDSSGVEIKAKIDIINDNRIIITTTQNYTNAKIEITGIREINENFLVIVAEQAVRLMMSVKNISVSYSINEGTTLPGYEPRTKFLGLIDEGSSFAPGFNFIAGGQNRDFAKNAGNKGWLSRDTTLNSPYIMTHNENINLRSSIEPINNFRIDVTASRSISNNLSEYYYPNNNGKFDVNSKMNNGSFSMTYNIWGTAFEKTGKNGDYSSETFKDFLDYRITIARRLAHNRANKGDAGTNNYNPNVPDTANGFPDGYGPTSPEVLIPAFLAAYGKKSPDLITLSSFPSLIHIKPNWSITYDGLTRVNFIKRYFKTFSISHAYRSTYSVNSFSSNLNYYEGGDGFSWVRYELDKQNFIPEYEVNGASLNEQFSPLINLDVTMINDIIAKIEIKKTRTLNLGFSNNQLIENKGNEIVVGTGYRLKDIKINVDVANFKKQLKSDVNLKLDLSIRNSTTITRKIVEEIDEITAGSKILTLKFSADYVISDRFNLRFFVDRIVNTPKLSNSFKTKNTNIGVSIRLSLTQ